MANAVTPQTVRVTLEMVINKIGNEARLSKIGS